MKVRVPADTAMSAGKAVPKLLAVTLIRSGISKPYWQKRTLQALGLTKIHKTMIHKNSPSVTGMLSSVKELIRVRPIEFRSDLENSPNKAAFFLDNGQAFVDCQSIPSNVTLSSGDTLSEDMTLIDAHLSGDTPSKELCDST